MPGQKKKCKICKQELPLDAFYKKRHGKYGVRAICKECHRIKDKEYYYRDVEKSREIGRQKNRRYYEKMNVQERKRLRQLQALHMWVKYHKEKQKYCSICNETKTLELSNLSGEYKRDITDYWWLCSGCHALFDRVNKTHKVVI